LLSPCQPSVSNLVMLSFPMVNMPVYFSSPASCLPYPYHFVLYYYDVSLVKLEL